MQAPSDPNAALQAVVRALETAAVVAAVGAHLAATAAAVRQQQQAAAPTPQRWQQQQLDEQQGSRRVAHAAAASPPVPQWLAAPQAGWASPSGLWLTLPLLAALVLGRIRAWLSGSRCAPQSAAGVGGVEHWRTSTYLPAVEPANHSARVPHIHARGKLSDGALNTVACPRPAWCSAPRRVSTEAAARLLRAEAAAGQQAQRIEELARQVGTC